MRVRRGYADGAAGYREEDEPLIFAKRTLKKKPRRTRRRHGELRGRVLGFDGWVRRAPEGTPKSRTPPWEAPGRSAFGADTGYGIKDTGKDGHRREMPQFWGEVRGSRHSLPEYEPPCLLRALQRSGWLIRLLVGGGAALEVAGCGLAALPR